MKLHFIAIISLLWAGMILGISFLESWVKFRAPSLTRQVGLDVGRTVFAMFSKIQNGIFITMVVISVIVWIAIREWILIGGIGIILLLQFFWLLPQLNSRAAIIIAGGEPASSYAHVLYGILEMLKLVLLFVVAIFD